MDEFNLIKNYFAPLAKDFPGSLNLRDDAALLDPHPGEQFVITKDAICEGVHFIGDENPGLIAQKLLRVNLSDLAAKGARPICYFLAVMAPKSTPAGWFAEFARGLAADQKQYGIHLAGGDTTATNGSLTLSLTMIGTLPKGTMLRRNGARAGDQIYVSGTLGDAALGLLVMQQSIARSQWLQDRYLLPQPRVGLGEKLQGVATSCMDISDGLVQDLGHICDASKIGAVIFQEKLPLSAPVQKALKKSPELWQPVLGGGDDYELLFTVPAQKAPDVVKLSKLGVLITHVGDIEEGSGVKILSANGEPFPVELKGYKHF